MSDLGMTRLLAGAEARARMAAAWAPGRARAANADGATLDPVPALADDRTLFAAMLRIRRIEEAIAARYAEQQMRCPVHLSVGQEAVAVGVCAALAPDDGVFSGHRAHAHYLAKGGSLPGMIAEIYGRATGCAGGVGGSMHMVDTAAGFLGAVPIVGSTIPLAVGAAWAAQLQGRRQVVAIFFGDGAFEEGVMHESLNFAALHRLPVLFVCENNLYACYTRLPERQPMRPIHGIAAAHGCAVYTPPGGDVRPIHAAAARAVAGLRAGGPPAFLEVPTYRWLEHCGHADDDHLGYRPATEVAGWKAHCAIARLRAELATSPEGEDFVADVEAAVACEIAAAFDAALEAPLPDPADLPGWVHG